MIEFYCILIENLDQWLAQGWKEAQRARCRRGTGILTTLVFRELPADASPTESSGCSPERAAV